MMIVSTRHVFVHHPIRQRSGSGRRIPFERSAVRAESEHSTTRLLPRRGQAIRSRAVSDRSRQPHIAGVRAGAGHAAGPGHHREVHRGAPRRYGRRGTRHCLDPEQAQAGCRSRDRDRREAVRAERGEADRTGGRTRPPLLRPGDLGALRAEHERVRPGHEIARPPGPL